jgi:hypothetical protein
MFLSAIGMKQAIALSRRLPLAEGSFYLSANSVSNDEKCAYRK